MVFINQKLIIICIGFIASIFLAFALTNKLDKSLEVHFIDIGQGDAIFIQTPTRNKILIDGGKRQGNVSFKVGSLMPFYDKKIDIVIATHADSDHIGGLIDVIDRFDVRALIVPSQNPEKELGSFLIESARRKNIKIYEAKDIARIILGEVVLEILPYFENIAYKNENQKSIVSKLVYRQDSFLFTGDIDKFNENIFIEHDIDVSADVLKVAHHGSKSSSSNLFIKSVNPKVAVIQSGENSYGHPNSEVLQALQGVIILRNDINGIVSLYSTGNSF